MEVFRLCIAEKEKVKLDLTKEENLIAERNFIVGWMRIFSREFELREKEIIIPDNYEKYGFIEGKYNVGQMLQFFADMLEE